MSDVPEDPLDPRLRASGVTSGSEALTPTTTLDYGHTGVLAGVTYWYRVRARNPQGVSELSGVIAVRVP